MPEIHKLPQPAQHAKPEPEERIILKHADNLRFNENEMQSAQRLSGNVVLMHKGMTMFCDSAMLYEQSQTFDAFGHVKLYRATRSHSRATAYTTTVKRSLPKCDSM